VKHYKSGLQNIRVSLMAALEDCDGTPEALEDTWTRGRCLEQIKKLREQAYKMTWERDRYSR
jgi:hypothetical protein